MKIVSSFLFAYILFFGACTKSASDTERDTRQIRIVNAVTVSTIGKGNPTQVSIITSEAPDLCYSFARFDLTPLGNKTFEIRALANYKPGVCGQAIYRVDNPLLLAAAEPGTYILRFYNGAQLFKADTVIVQ